MIDELGSVAALQERMWHIYGPPGTGKTTYLSKLISDAAKKHGSDRVMVSSFTRAGAQEIAGRGIPVAKHMVGTLHAICRRVLGVQKITESLIKEWNESHPLWRMSETMVKAGEPENMSGGEGDEFYNRLQLMRAKMMDMRLVDGVGALGRFYQAWEEFKRETDSMDFTDLIEECWHSVDCAPGNPTVGFFDEVQDFTPLELALVRKWGQNMQFFMLAGDDDQAIYSFKGASPEAFLDPPPTEDHMRFLRQSYRVPRQIQRMSQAWIQSVQRRRDKEYLPRDVEGQIRYAPELNFMDGDMLARDAERYLAQGKSVMFLGTCGYHVGNLAKALRANGIPFHNPYRRVRGDWNPLTPSRGTSASTRVLAYLAPRQRVEVSRTQGFWTASELSAWIPLVRAKGILQHGAKAAIIKMHGQTPLPIAHLAHYFEPEALKYALECTPEWLAANIAGEIVSTAKYPLAVVKKRGIASLVERPQVIIGTIHSVKGGEADVVYLFPDLSMRGVDGWSMRGPSRDAIIRQFYVGMTRPRETLIITDPYGPCVDMHAAIRRARAVEEF